MTQEGGHGARHWHGLDRASHSRRLHRLHAQTIPGALPESAKALSHGEWPAYAGTYAAARYSPLTQINQDNAKNLRVAWRWKSPDKAIQRGKSGRHRSEPCQ